MMEEKTEFTQKMEILQDCSHPIEHRMQALFYLRTDGSMNACEALYSAFEKEDAQTDKSDLLLHQICYCLGQMLHSEEQKVQSQKFLKNIVQEGSSKHSPLVIHEATESLGNISLENTKELLIELKEITAKSEESKEAFQIMLETCELTIDLERWREETENGKKEGFDSSHLWYHTNDPAPPFALPTKPEGGLIPTAQYNQKSLGALAVDPTSSLFSRYRALFTLRQIGTKEAAQALCSIFAQQNRKSCSALLKHEVAFIMGQMMHWGKIFIPVLESIIAVESEAPIARHEAALALGQFAQNKDLLQVELHNRKKYSSHSNKLVSESCKTAMAFSTFWKPE